MNKTVAIVLIIGVLSLFGCTAAQKGAAVGGAAGAGLGGIIGHQSGHGAAGAGIGAAVGAVSGALIADKMQKKFCPVCGKRFTSGTEYCPVDGTKLELIKE